MKLQEAIERANDMRAGNAAPDDLKIIWLTELDQQIYDDVILNHIQTEVTEQPNYTGNDTDTELIAPAPYSEMYIYWLMAKIDLFAQELSKYNNSLALFDEVYTRFANKYKREHRSKKMREIHVGRFW